jgi:hypothetical protein
VTSPPFTPPTPITCQVYVQGDRLADGSEAVETSPVVLSGLRLTWGRGTTVDQPDTATAAFTVEDTSGEQAFARVVALGKIVTLTATGTAYPAPSAGTFDDPTWDTAPLGDAGGLTVDTRAVATIEAVAGGGRRVRIRPATAAPGAALAVAIPPRHLGAPADPTGWDDIPVPAPGQTWRQTIGSGWAAPGAVLRVGVARFATPWDTAPAVDWPPAASWDPVAAPWHRDYTPNTAGGWQGTAVTADPPGYRWADVPADLTWATAPAGWTWDTMAGFALDDTDILTAEGAQVREVEIFAGRITDSSASWDTGAGAAVIDVIAADLSAELGNRDVGAEPWPAERLDARAGRILTAAGRTDVTLYIDPRPAAYLVGRLDVDRQQVYPMLADLATSVDAVLWPAFHSTTGAFLWVEDMQGRTPVEVLTLDTGSGLVVITDTTDGLIAISACDIDLDPVRWIQTNADVATRAVIDWQDQTTAPDPTQRTTSVVLTELEDPQGPYGVRRVQITSQVTTDTDATNVATGVLARLMPAAQPWRVGGLTYRVESDADAAHVAAALAMLDGTTRIGAPVALGDLPAWSPAPGDTIAGYLEGGVYTFEAGRWVLELVLSAGAGQGASITWAEMAPAWRWADLDPAIRWMDLLGVGPDSGGTRP